MVGKRNHRTDGRRICKPRLFRGSALVLLIGGILGAVVALVFSTPRMIGRQQTWNWVKHNNAMMRVLRWYNDARSRSAGSPRSATALLTHVGRRSGRTYQTPLGAYAYGDGFVLPMAAGSQADWCRNVMAAGTCTLAWKGQTHELVRPEIISGPEVMRAWPAWERIMLRAAGIHDFLWLHEKKATAGLRSSGVAEEPH